MRVYLPTTLHALRAVHAAGEVGPAPLTAQAVTPALREWYVDTDREELEYAALLAAAEASLALLADDPSAPPRRVVLAADVPDAVAVPRDGAGRAAVEVSEPVRWGWVASAHVDDEAAEQDVRAAVGALGAAEAGDEDARFVLDGVQDHELLWYAVQEVPDLIR